MMFMFVCVNDTAITDTSNIGGHVSGDLDVDRISSLFIPLEVLRGKVW